jgi:hypothetical protein
MVPPAPEITLIALPTLFAQPDWQLMVTVCADKREERLSTATQATPIKPNLFSQEEVRVNGIRKMFWWRNGVKNNTK